jgi:AcrR family transcriptional regulator
VSTQEVRAGDPVRGTRPRNRRELIVVAARDLFHQDGYDDVSMGAIADAVSIGPSALYRHFSGKQQLLFEVLSSSMVPMRNHLETTDDVDPDTWVGDLHQVAADNLTAGVLWQRESRHLPDEQRRIILDDVRTIGQLIAQRIAVVRPDVSPATADLLSWAALAVLLSPSFHRRSSGRSAPRDGLAELATSVISAATPVPRPEGVDRAAEPRLRPRSRREQLLGEAVRMFAERGYTNVGIEDIGSSLGMAGPSVYNHFPTKIDVLTTALNRGWAYLLTDLADALSTSADAPGALRTLVRSYVRFAVAHPAVIGLLITETRHLPEGARDALRVAQREYVNEWVGLVRSSDDDLSENQALTAVHAALAVVNDLARIPHLTDSFDVAASLELICERLLLPAVSP